MECTRRFYRVDRKQLYFLKFIFEACDGLASITTVDSGLGIVVLRIPPGCEADVDEILNDLKRHIRIEPCEADFFEGEEV